MNRIINQKVPLAIEAIKTYLAEGDRKLDVDKEYKGYISSLGASIVQAGLLPTLSFYTDMSAVRDQLTPGQRRNQLLKAIYHVIERENISVQPDLLHYCIHKIDLTSRPDDPQYSFGDFIYNSQNEKNLTRKILLASLAIKLALRAFNNQ